PVVGDLDANLATGRSHADVDARWSRRLVGPSDVCFASVLHEVEQHLLERVWSHRRLERFFAGDDDLQRVVARADESEATHLARDDDGLAALDARVARTIEIEH